MVKARQHGYSLLLIMCMVYMMVKCTNSTESGTCDLPEDIIFKHTVATSDSARDCANTYKIFASIHDEGADKFHDGQCAYQCKLQLPYTCFNIHAPQTYEYDAGLLYIDTFEKIISEKWKYALSDSHSTMNIINYDAFFDFNMGFWVQTLDEYISHWQSNEDIVEYFGIEWYSYDLNIDDNDFMDHKLYSILVHSPSSAINFEFISYKKPSNNFYNQMKWITDDIPRCTFGAMNNAYPWDRADKATIVPVRISHASTDIDKVYDFYVNILEANLLYYAQSTHEPTHTRTIFMHLIGSHIELQFIQRPLSQTFGSFQLDKYESLLMETHQSIITSPYCGQDRWMDNHYAYSTWSIVGLMDKIYFNLNHYKQLYKVGKNIYKLASIHTKYELDLINYDGQFTFGLWVIEPGGQSIKIGGIISEPTVAYFASTPDPQWCPKQCNFGLKQGTVDPSRIYVDDLRSNQHELDVDISHVLTQDISHISTQMNAQSYMMNIIIVVISVMILYCIGYYWIYYSKIECNNYCDDYDYMSI